MGQTSWSQRVKGRVARQAHVGLPEGTFEEEYGRHSFMGRSSHLYRTHPPTAWVKVEGEVQPRAFDLNQLSGAEEKWQRILSNDDVAIYVWRPGEAPEYFLRDAD